MLRIVGLVLLVLVLTVSIWAGISSRMEMEEVSLLSWASHLFTRQIGWVLLAFAAIVFSTWLAWPSSGIDASWEFRRREKDRGERLTRLTNIETADHLRDRRKALEKETGIVQFRKTARKSRRRIRRDLHPTGRYS